ncbi:MAG: HAD family phosphatase [Verrucomicrobia bacterium]|nr:HAD family phosphatase [Verrucomicrobiota bacterium]
MKPYQNNTPIRLVLADVDGTLVTQDKILTEKAKNVVNRLRDAGILFAITSGRPPLGMKMLVPDLKITTVIAGFNGGVYSTPKFDPIVMRDLPNDAAVRTLELIKEHRLASWLYTDTTWYITDPKGPHVERETKTVQFDAEVVPDYNPFVANAAKIVGISDDLDAVARCEKKVQEELGAHVSAARSQPYYLDVTHPSANKGGVVDFLSCVYLIPKDSIATIGDMPNDVLMFKKSGMSIAMGNSSDEVKAQANFVTSSNEEEGFAMAMDKFVLGGSK